MWDNRLYLYILFSFIFQNFEIFIRLLLVFLFYRTIILANYKLWNQKIRIKYSKAIIKKIRNQSRYRKYPVKCIVVKKNISHIKSLLRIKKSRQPKQKKLPQMNHPLNDIAANV